MSELNSEIGARIMGARELNELDREQFAARLNITTEQLENYEKGNVDIPVSIIHDISASFDISMTELLTGESARMSVFSVVRKGRGVGIERRKAYDYKSLAYNFADRKIDPFLITVEPNAADENMHMTSHGGQEFHYCLDGRLRIVIDKYETVLDEGDSIYFDSKYLHGMQALDQKPAHMLVIITGKE